MLHDKGSVRKEMERQTVTKRMNFSSVEKCFSKMKKEITKINKLRRVLEKGVNSLGQTW